MHISEVISILERYMESDGDMIIHDHEGFPIEEIEIMNDDSTEEGKSLIIHSEGDDHG